MKKIREVIIRLINYLKPSASDFNNSTTEKAICYACGNRECECDDDELYLW